MPASASTASSDVELDVVRPDAVQPPEDSEAEDLDFSSFDEEAGSPASAEDVAPASPPAPGFGAPFCSTISMH